MLCVSYFIRGKDCASWTATLPAAVNTPFPGPMPLLQLLLRLATGTEPLGITVWASAYNFAASLVCGSIEFSRFWIEGNLTVAGIPCN